MLNKAPEPILESRSTQAAGDTWSLTAIPRQRKHQPSCGSDERYTPTNLEIDGIREGLSSSSEARHCMAPKGSASALADLDGLCAYFDRDSYAVRGCVT